MVLVPHCVLRGCIQKFYLPPGARTATGTTLCHYVQLHRYFVSQSSEFCRYNPLCCFSTSVYCYCLFRYRLSPETFGCTLICLSVAVGKIGLVACFVSHFYQFISVCTT
jgi:hypothetical protein